MMRCARDSDRRGCNQRCCVNGQESTGTEHRSLSLRRYCRRICPRSEASAMLPDGAKAERILSEASGQSNRDRSGGEKKAVVGRCRVTHWLPGAVGGRSPLRLVLGLRELFVERSGQILLLEAGISEIGQRSARAATTTEAVFYRSVTSGTANRVNRKDVNVVVLTKASVSAINNRRVCKDEKRSPK
jgi:hypothetical protein